MKKKNIADKLTKKVEIKIDGKTFPIVITHNVLIEVEELSGLNLLSGEASILKPSFKAMRAMLYTCLRRAGAKYSLEQAGELIGAHNLMTLQEAFLNAWAASMPEADPDSTERPTTAEDVA